MRFAWALLLANVLLVVDAVDDLYILIDEISVYTCRGVKNEIKITEEDVQVVNEKGNKVYFIHAPGNYSLHFKRINVERRFGHLAGEIAVTLQVPIIEGPAGIRFDLPYTIIPETNLLTQQCDEFSGVVERNGRQFCRYCDLCKVGEQVENELNKGHEFLPRIDGEGSSKTASCGNIAADAYDFKRTIQLPSRSTLEGLIRSKVHGVDDEIQKRLNKGRGRFQVFLNLITAEKAPISKARWFAGSKECSCCVNRDDPSCDSLSYIYCNMEECKSGWALQCLHNTARVAACFSVEFNYRMTTSYADVLQFLAENGYPNQDDQSDGRAPPVERRREPEPTTRGPSRELSQVSQQQMQRTCVAAMPSRLTHLRRYCTIFWNEKLCCGHCEQVC